MTPAKQLLPNLRKQQGMNAKEKISAGNKNRRYLGSEKAKQVMNQRATGLERTAQGGINGREREAVNKQITNVRPGARKAIGRLAVKKGGLHKVVGGVLRKKMAQFGGMD